MCIRVSAKVCLRICVCVCRGVRVWRYVFCMYFRPRREPTVLFLPEVVWYGSPPLPLPAGRRPWESRPCPRGCGSCGLGSAPVAFLPPRRHAFLLFIGCVVLRGGHQTTEPPPQGRTVGLVRRAEGKGAGYIPPRGDRGLWALDQMYLFFCKLRCTDFDMVCRRTGKGWDRR